ncbi:hypothetical protein NM208_g13618 [Fusarium decemcellulare]|uniref:Uncharacterized protein n=1 Tax=Fusarium decemcellulare TaxID=57161 RepID=A0ACC1RLS1_9HYPO|nr:hypothetical protein NM208_g13618 [Fusarium decemcellulare]
MEDSQVTLTARCLCNTHVFESITPKSSLPLAASVCHCTSCRHLTGALCLVCALWPNENEDLSCLKRYSFSPNIDIFSCAKCSTQLFCRDVHTLVPEVLTGALDNTDKLIKYDRHIFVGDTKDGGSSIWFRKNVDGEPIKTWDQHANESKELLELWPASPQNTIDQPVSSELVPIWCHCRGVQLFLESGHDLIGGTSKIPSNPPDLKTGKYITSLDACDSCRLCLGADLICWTFVPMDHILPSAEATSSDLRFHNISELQDAVARKDPQLGTLSIYKSSENVARYHCSSCSATLFYTEQGRPGQVDIAIGVLDHPSGARAEGLLSWDYSHVDHEQDARGGWREWLVKSALEAASTRTD